MNKKQIGFEQREFKFRCWDRINKKMIKSPHFSCETSLTTNINKNFKYFSSVDFIFMQYTGMKDRNEKEIYEGDIVKFEHSTREFTIREVVYVFSHCCFSLKYQGRTDNFGLPRDWKDSFEVIGNIFENKDLLKNN